MFDIPLLIIILPTIFRIGEPALEALLAEGGRDLSVERVCQIFPFPLDGFQKKVRGDL